MADQVPASQTAPIDEFRILWTSQKKQKLKKWQDGLLRFHTYNKRMIVYDETRALVCDMYLQRADKVNAGDELEFEHHLVTVEEFKGTVVQDLNAIISPILERRQHRQLQVTYQQQPLYPERGMRLQISTQDSPLSTGQAVHPPALPRQIGGVGDAEHVSLTEILKRSAGQERSSSASIRTSVRSSAGPFRSGTTNTSTPGPDFRWKETPTRSVTSMRPPVRAEQSPVTPVRPIHPPEGILSMPPLLHCAQPTRNITAAASRGTAPSRMHSATFRHGVSSIEGTPESPFENSNTPEFGSNTPLATSTMPQAPNVTTVWNDVGRFQIRGSMGVVISSKCASTPLPLPPQIPRRVPFDPPTRSVPTDSPAWERLRSPPPQAALVKDGRIQQPEEEIIVSHKQTAYKRPTFTTPRTLAVDRTDGCTDFIVDDTPPLAPEYGWLVPKGRKRVSENLPSTTIKLGSIKRKMLICRSTIQRERSSEARSTTGELTGFLEAGGSRRRNLADSVTIAQCAEDLILGDTILAKGRGVRMDKAASITAVPKISAEITGFAVNRPGIFRRGGGGGGYDGQETSGNINTMEVHGNSKLSGPGPPLGSSSAYQASGVEHPVIVSDKTPGHNEKEKGKTGERAKGIPHAMGTNRVAVDGCLDEVEGLGNNGKATTGNSPTPPHPTSRRRERKKREQFRKAEGAKTEKGGNANQKSSEFGPWSIEAFDLIAWRPPLSMDEKSEE